MKISTQDPFYLCSKKCRKFTRLLSLGLVGATFRARQDGFWGRWFIAEQAMLSDCIIVLLFFTEQLPCIVAMAACASAHYWAREFAKVDHTIKMIPPIYVKPFVKRQKMEEV